MDTPHHTGFVGTDREWIEDLKRVYITLVQRHMHGFLAAAARKLQEDCADMTPMHDPVQLLVPTPDLFDELVRELLETTSDAMVELASR